MKQALIGYGGFAREVMAYMGITIPCFVDDKYFNPKQQGTYPLSLFNPEEYEILIAIADPQVREALVNRLPSNTKYFTYIHHSANILQGPHNETVKIGEGSYISAGVKIGCNGIIGKHTQLNWSTVIGHDSIIGDYFTTAPMAGIMGNNTIGDRVYFGTHACTRQKITICSDVTIGLGSGVVNNITEPGTYVGLPAKRIK